jgi:hypothetical protein
VARFHTANSDAQARGFPAPSELDEDAGLDFVRSDWAPNTVQGADPPPSIPFRTRGNPRAAGWPVNLVVRPFDQTEADRFTSSHGVISRAPIGPVGELTPWDQPRQVFRPIPQAWDAGYVNVGS